MQLLTNSAVDSPVTVADLEAYMGGADDGFYSSAISAASEFFVRATGVELLPRLWYGKSERAAVRGGIAPINTAIETQLPISVWPVIAIESLKLDGVTVTPMINTSVKPTMLSVGYAKTIEVELTAGHEEVLDERIIMAIKMVAGYIVEHRGACDLSEAATKSGAAIMINQLKLHRVFV